MQKKLNTTFSVLCLIFSLLGCSNGQEQPAVTTGLMKGQLAPDFSIKDLNGNQISLASFRNNKTVCLTFWATWCPYCIKEIPRLKEIYSHYSSKGVQVIAVNVASNDPINRVKAFQRKYEIPYPILYDESGYVSRLYGIQGIPVSLVIDRQGIIIYRGYQLPENINRLLEQKP